jgi:TatD DNase family protein
LILALIERSVLIPNPGVITYSTNLNTSNVIRNMVRSNTADPLRILLETDAPYMVPSSIYAAIPAMGSSSRLGKFPLSHAGMIPWTAQFVAQVANEVASEERWDVAHILEISQRNTKKVYGIE